MAKTKVGASNVIESPELPGRYLLVQETAAHKRWLFNFAGGSREKKDRSLIDCAAREAEEESGGLVVRPTGIVGIYDDIGRSSLQVVFASAVERGQISPSDEHPEVGYFSIGQVEEMHESGLLRSWSVLDAIHRHHAGRVADLDVLATILPAEPAMVERRLAA